MAGLIWLLLAHVLVEAVLITTLMQHRLRSGDGAAYLTHGLLLGLIMFGALRLQTGLPWLSLLTGAVVLALVHLLIDRFGAWLEGLQALPRLLHQAFAQVDQGLPRLLIWFLIQGLHLLALWAVSGLLYPPFYPIEQLSWHVNQHLWGGQPIALQDRVAYPILLLLVGSFGGAQFVRLAIQSFGPPEEIRRVTTVQTVVEQQAERDANQMAGETRVTTRQAEAIGQQTGLILLGGRLPEARSEATEERSKGDERSRVVRSEMKEERESPTDLRDGTGRWIGILERLLVMSLVALNSWQGIGLIFAAKSVARYRQLEHRAFVEYYIVGTLLSLLVGILFGLLLGRALGSLELS